LAIAAGKLITPMPYRRTKIDYRLFENDASCESSLMRARFQTQPVEAEATVGSLDEFLLERYRLYATGRRGELLHGDVKHPRWRTQRVDANLESNHFGDEFGFGLSTVPECTHFSTGVPALFGRFRKVDST
jgi:uncharacterized protein YqjF (DUF2071 family)